MTFKASLAARRVRQTLTELDNGPSVLFAMARHRVTGRPAELVVRVDAEHTITIPNRPGARVPIYEVFAEDEYRMAWFTADLGDEPTCLDIGAHVGCFTVAFARMHPRGHVESYEATPSTSTFLQRNIDDNNLESRARGHHLAVTGAAGSLEIADNGPGNGNNGVLHLKEGAPRVTVPSVSMAEAMSSAGRPVDIVKIDTEGGEYDMILGSNPSDWSTVRRVVLEYHDLPGHSWDELESFFASAGLNVVRREKYRGDRLGMAWLSRDSLTPPE